MRVLSIDIYNFASFTFCQGHHGDRCGHLVGARRLRFRFEVYLSYALDLLIEERRRYRALLGTSEVGMALQEGWRHGCSGKALH